ncbi:MAG: restriction endonuclease subunit S [Betaproteobacteria bacterium]|nr:restriction endonuclease subunit S [Betaproteobacteria bacterium]
MTVSEVIAADTSGLLGKHPSWERVLLADIAFVLNGAPFDSALFNTKEGMPLVRIRDVLAGKTITYYTGSYEDSYLVKQGDLLVGMDGDFNSGLWGTQTALLNQRVCKISPVDTLYDKRLLVFALPAYLAAINANTPSVTVKHLSSKTIGEIELPLPPRNEQTRIVAKLEELLSELDAGVAELKTAQKKLAQYRQSLLKAAVEGALTAEWRTQNPPAETGAQLLERILTERRARWEAKQLAKFQEQGKAPPKDWQKKYPEPVKPDTSSLPELPEGWVWASLDQLVSESSYGTSVKCSYESNGTPVLRIPNVSGGRLDLRDMKFSVEDLILDQTDHLAVGDVLVIRTNGSVGLVGRAAAVVADLPSPHYFASYLLRLRSTEVTCVHRWILAVLSSSSGRRWIEARAASSAGQHNISLSTLLSMPMPMPPLAEQSYVLNKIQDAEDSIRQQEASIELSLKQSAAQRQNILRAAFSGQLVPQDPNDEPASVLLERIRAERASQGMVKKGRGHKTKEII